MATAVELRPGTHRHTEQTIHMLAKSIRERDVVTYDHSRRVAIHTYRLARYMGWTRRRARYLGLAGLVHDLGKTWLKNDVLQKEAPLSTDEREEMKRHCEIGARILQIYAVPETIIDGVLYHQEMYNGQGYPYGLGGESIPLGGRLVAVVDVFDALASPRPYKKPMTIEATRDYLTSQSGQYFDPGVVKAFLGLLDRQPDFGILPRAEMLVPYETPAEWDEAPRPPRTVSAMRDRPIPLDQISAGLLDAFSVVNDLRPLHEQQSPLAAILALYVAAVLSGMRNLADIASWGSSQSSYALSTLGFLNGMAPSASRFRVALERLPVSVFEQALERWAVAMHRNLGTCWLPRHPSGANIPAGAARLPGFDLLAKYHMEYGIIPVYLRETSEQTSSGEQDG